MNYNNSNYVQEVDLIDLFWDWLSHWRSLLVFCVMGILLGILLMVRGYKAAESAAEAAEAAENATKIAQTEEQNQVLSTIELAALMSESERSAVQNLVDIYESYLAAKSRYENEANDMVVLEQAQTLTYLIQTTNYLESAKKSLSANQLEYYYALIGQSTRAEASKDEAVIATKNDETVINTTSDKVEVSYRGQLKKGLLCFALAVFLHIVYAVLIYLFSGTVKPTDQIGAMLGCNEMTKVVNWEKIDSYSKLDRIIANKRLHRKFSTSLEQAWSANAEAFGDIASNMGIKSVAIACLNDQAKSEASHFADIIRAGYGGLEIKTIGTITDDAETSKLVSSVDAVFFISKALQDNADKLSEQGKALKQRGVAIIGACMYVE